METLPPEWQLPAWPDDYHIDAAALGTSVLSARGQLVRVYQAGRHTEIIIPAEYAAALDSTRKLRAFLSGEAMSAEDGSGDDQPIDALVLTHALPEHFLSLIALLPDPYPLKAVVLVNHANPDDPHHRETAGDHSFVSAASARDGTITFFSPLLRPMLSEEFLHEAAHLYAEHYEGEMRWYRVAAELEAGGYVQRARAALRLEEDWAIHLGECVLGGSAESFARFCEGAPLRAAVIGRLMRRLLDGNGESLTAARALRARSHHLNSVVRARTITILQALVPVTLDADECNRTIQLLLALLEGEPLTALETVTSLDLSGAWLGRAEMQSLRGLPALRELDLSGTMLIRGSLEFLVTLPTLRILNLRGNELWTSDMEHVAQLSALESLDIGCTRVNASAIGSVGRMRSLRVLHVDGTELAESVNELRALLPECDVRGSYPGAKG
jgi:hypothetical protein